MWFLRRFGPLYRLIFNHMSGPIITYCNFFRWVIMFWAKWPNDLISSPMLLGPEDSRFSNSNADILLSKYKAHNAAVKALVPKERLLIYRIGDGWEPICKFLGKPIPGMVPRLNFSHWKRLKIVHVYWVVCIFQNQPENRKDVPFPHKNRLASGVEDLKNNLHYIASLRRQIISWGLRVFMLICKFKVGDIFADNL